MEIPMNQPLQELLNDLLDEKSRLEEYIIHPKDLIINDLGHAQRHFPRTPNHHRLFKMDLSPLNTELKVERNMQTGELLDFYEVESLHTSKTAKTSTSLKRAPGPPTESVRGSSTNFPFWPGGMDEPTLDELTSLLVNDDTINFESEFETVPPGFERGLDFNFAAPDVNELQQEDEQAKAVSTNKSDLLNEINIAQLLMDLDDEDEQLYTTLDTMKLDSSKKVAKELVTKNKHENDKDESLNEIIVEDRNKGTSADYVLNISVEIDPSLVACPKTEWAEIVNVNKKIDNFDKVVPNMAHNWDFKLDTFQQLAIMHLEKQESVFVAAHTSAGKTVIAEYAIALSLKHMTRTVYTSPIKALSNQKFRDFRETFKDVGLLTGDIQLFPNSSCLVMTTEILRLMLYNGSDVIRDLEWVIFDEVHYINDAERGVVWEEVLIMLPKHVNIVLLSATVPNTLEFADWIGRTKKKKIYVLSTPKRPVPLEHFLYVGNSPKVQNELFNIVTSDSKFNIGGYNAAMVASKDKKDKTKHLQRNSFASPQQERNILINLVRLLEKKNQLPVIIFTFSRIRCDSNASMLSTIDLTTAPEKEKARDFVRKCILRLKGSDRRLQQVLTMQTLLERGIGVHHSGILPILREVVELLFQQGLVKLLFATETFAMGVNMPAKTVIFDTTRKHDGTELRDLNTAEYIQMAGRAGRRGLDTTGTVIILCKSEVPEKFTLENMILGKSVLLQSRFRLTYTMMLNLLRVEQLRVQDMMKRSFSEVGKQKSNWQFEKRFKQLSEQMSGVVDIDCRICSPEIEEYYRFCLHFVQLRQQLMSVATNHQLSTKIICPGRVMMIVDADQGQTLAVVVKVIKSSSSRGQELTIYVLIAQQRSSDQNDVISELQPKSKVSTTNEVDNSLWKRLLYVNRAVLQPPDGPCRYNVVKCAVEDIVLLTREVLKIDGDRVYSDWDKRQLPRFRDDPPSQLFVMATQELLTLQNSGRDLEEIDMAQDFGVRDLVVMEKKFRLASLRQRIGEFQCSSCPSFEDHFRQVFTNTKLKDEMDDVKHHLSEDSLQLKPDFESRIQVLQKLGYIDSTNTVQLKGRVACEISNHELIITELVFDNVLTNLEPPEIAALLSCMVFQMKRCSKAELTERLKRGKEVIQNTAMKIELVQRECGLNETNYTDQFNFELAEVVYEWARGMTFVKIMELTNVQEGIIVRCIQRLDEILKNVKDAARIVGDPVLYKKMEDASQAIKRDIVFAASLYTQ